MRTISETDEREEGRYYIRTLKLYIFTSLWLGIKDLEKRCIYLSDGLFAISLDSWVNHACTTVRM